MFKIFHGFHMVEAYHKKKRENRSQESSVNKRIITALILSVITLIIWNLPAGVFGIDGLTNADVDNRGRSLMGHLHLHHGVLVALHLEQRYQTHGQ